MDSATNGEGGHETHKVMEKDRRSTSRKLSEFIPIDIPIAEKSLITQPRRNPRFLDFLKANPPREWFLKSGFVGRLSRFTFLKRNGSQSISSRLSSNPPTAAGRQRFRVPFVRKINWAGLITYSKNWVKHPLNMALLIWFFFVAGGIFALFLLMTGILDGTITKDDDRKRWTEIFNQIVNALFTIMCIYQHPKIFHHFACLCRWKSSDIMEVRKVYCKDLGSRRPNERSHIMFVVILLHITCFSQYVLCALYWGFTSSTRPDWANYLLAGIGTLSPIIAGLYTVYSPLGKRYGSDIDEESQRQESTAAKPVRVELRQSSKRVVVTRPQWVGGLYDCWDDLTVAYLSFFCTFCVFGWNMERLGFGNMYVHIFTFILLCIAPFWVFNVSALNINNDVLRYTLGITGVVLCFFGLLYGGFWRIQMRKKFKLPANPFCCGYPMMTDFMQWLFCWSCSLAQEVRTVNFYDIEEQSFYRWEAEEESRPGLVPLPREGGSEPVINSSFENSIQSRSSPAKSGEESVTASMETARDCSPDGVEEELPTSSGVDHVMRPPLQPLIELEHNQQRKT